MLLRENLSFDDAKIIVEHRNEGKDLYMKGLFIEGDIENRNNRIYPRHEIHRAVNTIVEQINKGYSVLGEVDHPEDLKINLDRVSHMVTEMWIEGANGYGKLKLLPTPMGNIIKVMLESDVKLGVSSRGSGNVNEATGHVSDYVIETIDMVAQPSAPSAYPTAIYEGLMNMRGGLKMYGLSEDAIHDYRAQKYLKEEVIRLIKDLKI